MTRDELLALMDHFSASVLYRMEYEEGDTRLVLEKAPPAPAVPLMAAAPAAVPAAAVAPAAPAAKKKQLPKWAVVVLVVVLVAAIWWFFIRKDPVQWRIWHLRAKGGIDDIGIF